MTSPESVRPPISGSKRFGWIRSTPGVPAALLFATYTAIALLIYSPSFGGHMISDDGMYLSENPYVQELSIENLRAIVDPTSVVPSMVVNYAPVHLLLHAGNWALFGPEVFGHHVVNVLVHALGCALLALFLYRCGVGWLLSALLGAVMLLHPANVEAVAWISQLKTTSSFALALLALLAHPRRPMLGLLLFGLALLAKPTAAVAFFVVVALGWVHAGRAARAREASPGASWRWPFVAGWAGVLLAFAIAEFYAFSFAAPDIEPLYADPLVRLRTTAAIGLRYLVMAYSGSGVAMFHEPPAVESWFDLWWLGALVALAAILWRAFVSARDRSMEFVFWIWAAVSYGPISGVIEIPFPMADRYLYFILPGLMGALYFALAGEDEPGSTRVEGTSSSSRVAWAVIGLLCVFFALQSASRARAWGEPVRLLEHTIATYPDGSTALTRRAQEAASRGDVEAAVAILRTPRLQTRRLLFDVMGDPSYAPIGNDPRFGAFLREQARQLVEQRFDEPSQIQIRMRAQAHLMLGEYENAERLLRSGLEMEGPVTDMIRADLENVMRVRRGGF